MGAIFGGIKWSEGALKVPSSALAFWPIGEWGCAQSSNSSIDDFDFKGDGSSMREAMQMWSLHQGTKSTVFYTP